VVSVALDLGIVQLRRGQERADPVQRRVELEKAEKTFKAIQGVAGDTDEFRVSLGQVYYWLGKHAEGRKLFDEFLATRTRNGQSLILVSRLLREVGAVSEARKLTEEAYAKESDNAKRYEAAVFRSLMPLDVDDEILWLGRANPADTDVQAMLNSSLGNKALLEGKESEAANHLRQALKLYGAKTPSASSLNNSAVAYLSLYHATGEAEALDKRTELLEKAVALAPRDSILLHNASQSLLESSFRDLIGPAIDFKALKVQGSQGWLRYLYQDQASKQKYAERVRQHPGVAKAISHYERLLVLAPKQADAYAVLAGLYKYTRNREALQDLWKRLQEVDLDLTDSIRHTLDHLAGNDDEKDRKQLKASAERWQGIVQDLRKGNRGTTFAIAASQLAQVKLSLLQLEPAAGGLDEVVTLTEEAHTAAPSSATLWFRMVALMARANQTLARQEPAYAALATKKHQRSLGDMELIAVALGRARKLHDTVLANPDVRSALVLLKESHAKFPDTPSEWEWAVLRAAESEEADQIAKALREDDLGRLQRAIELRLAPASAAVAFQAYWALLAEGKEAEGVEILQRCAARGVPLPLDWK
jgi:hypothetical protein